jgi:hypothetical protein
LTVETLIHLAVGLICLAAIVVGGVAAILAVVYTKKLLSRACRRRPNVVSLVDRAVMWGMIAFVAASFALGAASIGRDVCESVLKRG